MTGIEATTLFVQLLVPAGLIARVAFAGHRTRFSWVVDLALAASYVAAIALAGLWLALPAYLPWVFLILLVGAAAVRIRSSNPAGIGPASMAWRVGLAFRAVLVVVFVTIFLASLSGRQRFDEAAVDLEFPLREGTYLVASGGSHRLVNFHLETRTGERYQPYRGQSYAVDLVKVGLWGSRTSGFSPDVPGGFAIFGDSLHAPCSGTVVRAVDGQPDQAPGPGP
jgi:hypothetical protein